MKARVVITRSSDMQVVREIDGESWAEIREKALNIAGNIDFNAEGSEVNVLYELTEMRALCSAHPMPEKINGSS